MPMIIANVLHRWRAIGFKVDKNRVFLAATSFLKLKNLFGFPILMQPFMSKMYHYSQILKISMCTFFGTRFSLMMSHTQCKRIFIGKCHQQMMY